ncbi:glycosyltransferase family 2 protein [bacterium]|nr:glycosyltransferase family 2 protein [bacterium]
MSPPRVAALIVSYEAPAHLIKDLLDSLRHEPLTRVLVVDNASEDDGGVSLAQERGAEILSLPTNRGFGAAVNAGMALLDEEWVLVLNFDITAQRGAVNALLRAATHPKIASIAPKILLFDHPKHLDCVGTQVHPGFLAANRGIGQPDLGQFDANEPILGSCFGAAFINRKAFQDVGDLWAPYFLYYEDIDWCWRARIKGWTILSAPQSTFVHRHSWHLRHKPTAEKYYWVQSNLLLALVRLGEPKRAILEILRRIKALLHRASKEPDLRGATLRLLIRFVSLFPKAVASRFTTQKGRVVSDGMLFAFSEGHRGCFDDTGYSPLQGDLPRRSAHAHRWSLYGNDGDKETALGKKTE